MNGESRTNLLSELGSFAQESGDLDAAKRARERVLERREASLPDDHPDLQQARAGLAITIKALGDLDGARALEEKVLEVRSRTLPDDDPDLQRARANLANTIDDLGDLAGARALKEKVLEIRSRTLPDDHPDLQRARMNLAVTIGSLGDLEGARALEEKVLEVFSRTLAADAPDLQAARLNLAATIAALGDLKGARALEAKVLEVCSRTLPDDHPDLQAARLNLAGTIEALGDLAGARALEEKVLEVRSRTLPDDHPDLQLARQNLALTIEALGDLAGARALEEKVLEVRSRKLPEDHPDLQRARLNLAATLFTLGDLQTSRTLDEQVLEALSRILPDDHPDLQLTRQNLAGTLHALGDLAGARALDEKVLEIRSRTLSDDHPDLQLARGNLANTLAELGDLAGARALEERVLEVCSRTLPDDHPDLQAARMNLALTIKDLGDVRGARTLLEKVIEVRSRTLPDDHPALQSARNNLAVTLWSLGDLAGARALAEKVLEARSRTFPDEHPEVQSARGNLALAIATQICGDPGAAKEGSTMAREAAAERCAQLVLALSQAQTRLVRSVMLSSPSREAEERCAHLADDLDIVISFARGLGVFERSPGLDQAAFALSESTRDAAIASAGLARNAKAAPRYTELREELVRASDELATLAEQGATNEIFDAARRKRESAERDLIALAAEVAGGRIATADLDASAVSRRLGEGAASVSFRRFTDHRVECTRRSNGADAPAAPSEISTVRLGAFVVRGPAAGAAASERQEVPLTFVDLGPIEEIEHAVRGWRESLGVGAGRGLGAVTSSAASRAAQASGDDLRRLVFDPLLAAIGKRERIVVVLDDVLHLVAFDALPLDPGGARLLGDRWKIETRATLGELWNETPSREGEGGLLAMGGISYDGGDEETARRARGDAQVPAAAGAKSPAWPTRVARILRGGAWHDGFPELPETASEAEGIGAAFRAAIGAEVNSTLLERERATREGLLELAPKARFLHIATHGWYASESIKSWSDPRPIDVKSGLGLRMSGEEQVKGMSPMLLCGLALAGANLPENAVGRAPGLVTAEELSALDLSNCELAVLSACDTNVGERRAGQGVASFQRALQMAGARSVMTSLWRVPDEATKELMLDFYRRIWVEKEPKGRALWESKKRLREAKDPRGLRKHSTRDWAAWVLTGDPN